MQPMRGYIGPQDNPGVLIIDPSEDQVYVRYALLTHGSGELIFPELLLDDWGHEIRTLALYQWIHENGDHFPRAELFGFDKTGKDQQHFLRELDFRSAFPCYGYVNQASSLSEGVRLDYFIVVDNESFPPYGPVDLSSYKFPMTNADVNWLKANEEDALQLAATLPGRLDSNAEDK